ncbi:hypothetical protein BV22DRAFT_981633, partial [Leucogyrophana mollusca]
LFCWVRGDDTMRIFSVEITDAESVYALKKRIKKQRSVEWRYVSANDFDLSVVSLPVRDGAFLAHLRSATPRPLLPEDDLSTVFTNPPEKAHVHIIVDVPPNPPVDRMIELMCWVRGEDVNCTFLVEIADTDTVDDLKKQIKAKRPVGFCHVPASDLGLTEVSVPVDDNLRQNIGKLTPQPLFPLDELSTVFADPPADAHVHIIIDAPPKPPGECSPL